MADALRILHVAHGWPPGDLGGTELYAAALAAAQARAGAVVTAWTPAGLSRRPLRFRETFDRAEADGSFGAACAAARPDVVHVHHLTGASMGIPAVARAQGARVVVTLHDAWLACARGHPGRADRDPHGGGGQEELSRVGVVARRDAKPDALLAPSGHNPRP